MKRFTKEAYKEISTIRSLCASPDGRYVMYPVQTMNVEKDSYITNLWVYDSKKEREFCLTSGANAGFYFWIDSDTVAFSSVRGDGDPSSETVYYAISLQGGEAQVWMRIPRSGAQISKLNDGTYLVRAEEDLNKAGEGDEAKWMRVDEYPYFQDGGLFCSKIRRSLFIYDPADSSLKKITPEYMNVQIPFFSQDVLETEDAMFFPSYTYDKDAAGRACICRYDKKSGECQNLCEDSCYIYSLWIQDDRIYYGAWAIEEGPYVATVRIKSVSLFGGDVVVEAEPEWELGSVRRFEEQTYIICNQKGHGNLALWDGKKADFIDCGEVYPSAIAPAGDVIYFVGQKKDRLGEVYAWKDGNVKQLSHRNDMLFEQYEVSRNESLTFLSGSDEIDGWILPPVSLADEKKYPAILNIHGGPHGYFTDFFIQEHQCWAESGYYVIFCNPKGSTTYGRDFQDITGKMGFDDYQNIMDFVDAVLKTYRQIDPQRIAVTGQSYGGYMSNWMIGHTDRFACAVPRMSISNWFSMHGTSVERWYGDVVVAATPWKNPELLWELSPLKYAKNVKTPTMFIQHEKDQYTPLEQAQQMFLALLENGVETQMYINKGCGHGGRRVSHLIHDIEIMLTWFDHYLKEQNEDQE